MNISNCPTCGYPLTSEHLIGRFLKCPACRQQFLFQNDILSKPSVFYRPVEVTWEIMTKHCFQGLISQGNVNRAKSLNIKSREEVYVPFLEVVNSSRQKQIYPAVSVDLPWHNIKISLSELPPVVVTEEPHDESLKVISYESEMIEDFSKDCLYVSSSILYIPVKRLVFEFEGETYECYAHVGEITIPTSFGVCDSKEEMKVSQKTPILVRILVALFCLAVIVAAWYKFCYIYWHFHGADMFYYASGYKCFLPFLGIVFLAMIAYNYLCSTPVLVLSLILKCKYSIDEKILGLNREKIEKIISTKIGI